MRYHFFYYNYFIDENFSAAIPRIPERIGQVIGESIFRFQYDIGLYIELILEAQWVDFSSSHSLDCLDVSGEWVSDIVFLDEQALTCCSVVHRGFVIYLLHFSLKGAEYFLSAHILDEVILYFHQLLPNVYPVWVVTYQLLKLLRREEILYAG